ncbi:hypothetical protein [Coleofasciculus sp. H7-2]|uniref:hypothetical protein n=1 Tax=Coleofasciculus sp. H7-2 TaxID=3351545 RepID=UPI00366DB79B
MTKAEILAALKQMTTEERLEIIEAASRMIREEREEKARRKAEIKQWLAVFLKPACAGFVCIAANSIRQGCSHQPDGFHFIAASPFSRNFYIKLGLNRQKPDFSTAKLNNSADVLLLLIKGMAL